RLTSDSREDLRVALRTATPERVFQIKRALLAGVSVDEVAQASGIDPWFLFQMEELLQAERWFAALPPREPGAAELRRMKRMGFSDAQLGTLRGIPEKAVRETRWRLGVHPAYKTVDTCGGQTPLRLTKPLEAAGVPILGTAPDSIDVAEDRERFEALADRLGVTQPANGTARSVAEAVKVAGRIGFPVLVRPSYVLGGRAM